MRFRRGATALAALVCIASVAAQAPSRAASSQEVSLFRLINRERTSRGIPALQMSSHLNSIAGDHAARMARAENIFHNDAYPRLVRLRWTKLGENVGYAKTVGDLHHAMMSSPGHRSEMLDRAFTMAGIGIAWNDGWLYAVEDFAAVRISRASRTTVRAHSPVLVRVVPRRAPPPPVDRDRAAFTVRALVRMVRMGR